MKDEAIKIFTMGFTGSSAEHLFERLSGVGVKKVIDTRLWASSQLAGFACKKDLPYFVKELAGAGYEYREDLDLINHRNLAKVLSPEEVDQACFLCACKTEFHCHRRLIAEYLQREWNEQIEIIHL